MIRPRILEILEFTKVREHFARYTSFSASRELALTLEPSCDTDEVCYRIARTSEARRFVGQHPALHMGGAHDIRPHVDRALRGGMLEGTHLLEIATTIDCIHRYRVVLYTLDATTFPVFSTYFATLPQLDHVANAIERTFDDDGSVVTHASPMLSSIRSDMRLADTRINDKLHHMLNSPKYAQALQEPIITVRGGRKVVPVKAAHRREIPGLVHDQSASGATLYIEPIALVELNNRLRELALAEEQEINRILLALSGQVAQAAHMLIPAVETLATIDLACALAHYATDMRCVPPIIGDAHTNNTDTDGTHPPHPFSLVQARHPLLNQQHVVPIDVWLGDDTHLLIITGPNTGGKTVALKTVGLLVLMAQAGCHIPVVAPAHLPIFHHIFVDIGDEQSIEQSLSTFSSHMTTIIRMINELMEITHTSVTTHNSVMPQSLVLLDELGAGTDPVEGAALARAIIEYLLQHQCMGIVTTHYAELKAFAHNTPGVQNASVEFNVETLAPTYRLHIGLPGRSNALVIAQRLGLPGSIVERARGDITQDSQTIEHLLEDIHRKQEMVTMELQRVEALRDDADKYRQRLAYELHAFDATREEHMRDALREVEDELRELRTVMQRTKQHLQTQADAASRQQLQDTEQHIEQLSQHAHTMRRKQQPVATPVPINKTEPPLQAGNSVFVQSVGLAGTILDIDTDDQTANVQVGSFRVRVSLHEVRRDTKSAVVAAAAAPRSPRPSSLIIPDVSMSLDMRGWRVADVAIDLERYINDAYLASLPEVRLVHGKGSGALRHAVQQFLHKHPLVKTFCAGGQDGGDGVTLVRLHEQ